MIQGMSKVYCDLHVGYVFKADPRPDYMFTQFGSPWRPECLVLKLDYNERRTFAIGAWHLTKLKKLK
jgi:hypothetical protein